jgi:hypothetical protein
LAGRAHGFVRRDERPDGQLGERHGRDDGLDREALRINDLR